MPDTVRTFLAVEINETVRGRAAELIAALDAAGAPVKWVQRQNMHLTLKFLDEVPLRDIARVSEAARRTAAAFEPFDLEIRGAGAFPNLRRPSTVWLGAGDGAERLSALATRLDAALGKLGFRKESRRFEAHLTIGRLREGGLAAAELGRLLHGQAGFEAGRTRVAEVIVFSSQLTPKGPIYEALDRTPLGNAITP